jgi:hypothetical protein
MKVKKGEKTKITDVNELLRHSDKIFKVLHNRVFILQAID